MNKKKKKGQRALEGSALGYKSLPVAGCDEIEGFQFTYLILKSPPMYNKLGMFKAFLDRKLTVV